MCENIINFKYRTQISDEDEYFQLGPIEIGVLSKFSTFAFDSIFVSEKQNFYTKGPIQLDIDEGSLCIDKNVIIIGKGLITINDLTCGPYEKVGGSLVQDNLYFHFKNLKINCIVSYFFNPYSICVRDFDSISLPPNINELIKYYPKKVLNRYITTNGGLLFDVNKDKGITFDEFYISFGKDGPKQDFYDLLTGTMKDYSGPFGIVFDRIASGLADRSIFSDYVRNEFLSVYCMYSKENPYNPPNIDIETETNENKEVLEAKGPNYFLSEKLIHFKTLGLYSTLFQE